MNKKSTKNLLEFNKKINKKHKKIFQDFTKKFC